MNTENVRLWLEDLESSRHPQAKKTLCRLDEDGEVVGYCCLGRACEVAIAHGLELTVRRRVELSRTMYNNISTLLPEAVEEWLGIGATDLKGSPGDFYAELATMNDSGATFPEIARYIRERLALR